MALFPMPPLMCMEDYDDNWERYQAAIYQNFLSTVVQADLRFLGLPISCKKMPEVNGMHSSFWHLITEDLDKTFNDEDRTPDFRRCERVSWIAHVIENANDVTSGVHCWEKKVRGDKHILLWVEQEKFLVVLARRKEFLMLKTIYQHSSRKQNSLVKDKMRYKDPRND